MSDVWLHWPIPFKPQRQRPIELRMAPSSIQELKALVVSRGGFSRCHRIIGNYAFLHPYDVAFATAKTLAEVTGTSVTSVHRFSDLLGYASFSDFRAVFRKHVSHIGGSLCIEELACGSDLATIPEIPLGRGKVFE